MDNNIILTRFTGQYMTLYGVKWGEDKEEGKEEMIDWQCSHGLQFTG